jgi:hypothetical protein
MTIIDEILIAANKIANEGKKPTVALVKAKLSTPTPLPTIISVLKTWQHDESFVSDNIVVAEKKDTTTVQNGIAYCTRSDLETLQQNIIDILSTELNALKSEIVDIKKLLIKK